MVPHEVAMIEEEEEKVESKVLKSRALKLNHKTNSKTNSQVEARSIS